MIADTSAWARAHREEVAVDWAAALRGGQLTICLPIAFELLYVERDHAALIERERDLALLRSVPITVSVQSEAMRALVALSDRGPLHHRVPLPDLLIAAAAQEAGLGVLHYDHHYDRLAEILSFDSRWIAEPGSL